jgi:hypothetical protein
MHDEFTRAAVKINRGKGKFENGGSDERGEEGEAGRTDDGSMNLKEAHTSEGGKRANTSEGATRSEGGAKRPTDEDQDQLKMK